MFYKLTKINLFALQLRAFSTTKAVSRNANNKWAFFNTRLYRRVISETKVLGAKIAVKGGRPLVNHINNMFPLMGIRISLNWIKVTITFLAFSTSLIKGGGLRFLVIYLKAAHVALQQSIGGHYLKDMTPLGVRISRSKSGKLPRIIPVLHRERIRSGDERVIRYWLTLFSLYRIIEFKGKLDLSSITDPGSSDPLLVEAFGRFLKDSFIRSLNNLCRGAKLLEGVTFSNKVPIGESTDVLKADWFRAKPFLISKSTPVVKGRIVMGDKSPSPLSTSPLGILVAAWSWLKNPDQYLHLARWCSLTGNIWILNRIQEWGDISASWHIKSKNETKRTFHLGGLGLKEEAAGKIRVFALVDPFTQWVMHPLYKSLQQLLRLIPQDGEQDQYAPIHRLWKTNPKGPFFSYDLKSATDRLPIEIQKMILAPFLSRLGADLWASLLVDRKYRLVTEKEHFELKYAVGQPMGALSSWHMLSLTHHAIVQWSAIRAGVVRAGEWFKSYAILGDDIVIADAAVAAAYLIILDGLGVKVGLAKSLISTSGAVMEFAKRFMFRGKDLSPVPFKEYWMGIQSLPSGLELARKYSLSLMGYLTFRGFGYRVKGAANRVLYKQSRKIRHAILAYYNPDVTDLKPGALAKFFAMKSITSNYKLSNVKIRTFIERFVREECSAVLDRLNSEAFMALMSVVSDFSQVRRDREWYGTTKRQADRLTSFKDIMDTESPRVQRIFDSLKETVYREAFLDVRIEIRDLRNELEEFLSGPFELDSIEAAWLKLAQIEDTLSELPLPRELYSRVEEEARSSAISSLKRWEKYSPIMRSTHS